MQFCAITWESHYLAALFDGVQHISMNKQGSMNDSVCLSN